MYFFFFNFVFLICILTGQIHKFSIRCTFVFGVKTGSLHIWHKSRILELNPSLVVDLSYREHLSKVTIPSLQFFQRYSIMCVSSGELYQWVFLCPSSLKYLKWTQRRGFFKGVRLLLKYSITSEIGIPICIYTYTDIHTCICANIHTITYSFTKHIIYKRTTVCQVLRIQKWLGYVIAMLFNICVLFTQLSSISSLSARISYTRLCICLLESLFLRSHCKIRAQYIFVSDCWI